MLIEEAIQRGARIEPACEILDLSPETLRRWKNNPEGRDGRAGPLSPPPNVLTEEEVAKIIQTVNLPRFRDKSPWQIVPSLADEDEYIASESSFYRVMRRQGLLAHRGRSRPRQNQKPEPLVARQPNELWSWDITYLCSEIRGLFFYLYLVMDIFSRKIVGWEVHDRENSELASDLIDRICKEQNIPKGRLRLHSDNGGPMKGATLLATLERLGVTPSRGRPRVSDDNPYSESLFKTLKYQPDFPDGPFGSIEHARAWVASFVQWYNTEHLHSEIRYVTPDFRHAGLDHEVLAYRSEVYARARAKNPQRWSGKARNWTPIQEVYLNHSDRRKGAMEPAHTATAGLGGEQSGLELASDRPQRLGCERDIPTDVPQPKRRWTSAGVESGHSARGISGDNGPSIVECRTTTRGRKAA